MCSQDEEDRRLEERRVDEEDVVIREVVVQGEVGVDLDDEVSGSQAVNCYVNSFALTT